jgi:DNA-directed RNA polymerase specialized sigma54-like protein
MHATQEQAQQLTQTQKIAPHVIQASEILQCSSQELVQTIERELMENPALDNADAANDPCSNCDLPPMLCVRCPQNDWTISTKR